MGRVDPWETQQEGWTPTYQVLQHFKEELSKDPDNKAEIKMLCGADLLESFAVPNLWSDKDVRTSIKLCRAKELDVPI